MALKRKNYIIKDDIFVLNGKFIFFYDLADIKAGRPPWANSFLICAMHPSHILKQAIVANSIQTCSNGTRPKYGMIFAVLLLNTDLGNWYWLNTLAISFDIHTRSRTFLCSLLFLHSFVHLCLLSPKLDILIAIIVYTIATECIDWRLFEVLFISSIFAFCLSLFRSLARVQLTFRAPNCQ